MKFLEAQQQDGKEQKQSILPDTENKMQRGTRSDQKLDPKDPQSLISSPRRSATTGTTDTTAQSTPAAQKLAKEQGIDLAEITGTGSGGQITEADVRKHISTRSSGSPTENK